jgi:hypothetical protein
LPTPALPRKQTGTSGGRRRLPGPASPARRPTLRPARGRVERRSSVRGRGTTRRSGRSRSGRLRSRHETRGRLPGATSCRTWQGRGAPAVARSSRSYPTPARSGTRIVCLSVRPCDLCRPEIDLRNLEAAVFHSDSAAEAHKYYSRLLKTTQDDGQYPQFPPRFASIWTGLPSVRDGAILPHVWMDQQLTAWRTGGLGSKGPSVQSRLPRLDTTRRKPINERPYSASESV